MTLTSTTSTGHGDHQQDHKTVANLHQLIRLQYLARSLPLTGNRNVQSLMMGHHQSRQRGRGMNFEELRHYRIGDDIRQMDWKVTNRTRKPHVRVYAEEREQPVLLVVDQRLPMYFGSKRMMKSVLAAEMAALLAWHIVHKGDRIGLLIFNDRDCHEIRPRRSQNQIMRILHLLCDYGSKLGRAKTAGPGAEDSSRLNAMINRINNLVSHDAAVHIISDMDQAKDETGNLLSRLARHNDVYLNYIYDPLENQLPQQGRLAVSDGHFQVELDAEDQRLQENYKTDFDQRLTRIQDFLRSRKIPVRPLSTDVAIEEQLLRMQGGRRR